MSISNIEADAVRDTNVAQHDCAAWTQHQNGRLTTSLFHDVFVRKPTTNPKPLIKKIMRYEQNDLSHVPAIRWGFKMRVLQGCSMLVSCLQNITILLVI